MLVTRIDINGIHKKAIELRNVLEFSEAAFGFARDGEKDVEKLFVRKFGVRFGFVMKKILVLEMSRSPKGLPVRTVLNRGNVLSV